MELLKKTWRAIKRPLVYRSVAAGVFGYVVFRYVRSIPPAATLTAFSTMLKKGKILEIIDYGSILLFRTQEGWSRTSVDIIEKQPILTQSLEKGTDYSSAFVQLNILETVAKIGATIVCFAGLYYIQRFPEIKRKLHHDTNLMFNDIAGNDQAKIALQEIISFFKHPSRFQKLGARLPRGVLLYGPPGTGKTMLAKAVACEAGVSFVHCSGSEFIEKYVGVGARRVRDLFEQARENTPCIVFIDEIDSLGAKRVKVSEDANVEQHSTVNQLLSEMDGFVDSSLIVVIGATNNHVMMDEALLRPGRFDRKIEVALPSLEHRRDIISLNLKDRDNTVTAEMLSKIAQATENCNGAEIASVVNEACFISIRKGEDVISDDSIGTAFEYLMETKRNFQHEKMIKYGVTR